MDYLELNIPPFPYLVTINKFFSPKGFIHEARNFSLYDIIIVCQGVFPITEDNIAYELHENQMLVLEPGKFHFGHKPCPVNTLLYYLHFSHQTSSQTIHSRNIQWNKVFPITSYHDLEPQPQKLYIPKYVDLKVNQYVPILEEMVALRNHPVLNNMLPLQSAFSQFLVFLQKTTRDQTFSRSEQICDSIIHYLYNNMDQSFQLETMAQQLNYTIDYLSKCLKKHTGLTPLQYLNHIRIKKAVTLMEHTDLTLQEISHQVGIFDYNYFFRLFRKHIGMPPAKYRARLFSGK